MKNSEICDDLFLQALNSNFEGDDPFDGLNANVFIIFPFLKNSLFGLAWLQFFKRSRVNFRSISGIHKARNPKGIGLFISGMLEQYKFAPNKYLLNEAEKLGDWLLDNQCDKKDWGSPCWGYHFDWKSRAFFVPKGQPNVISTVYICKALYKLGKTLQRDDFVEVACAGADFIVNHLYTEYRQRKFFAYIPGETAFIHNASLWAAAWVGFVGSIKNNSRYLELASTVAHQSVSEQSEDGSWVYGSSHHHNFIDGFHTGYNLEALHDLKYSLDTTKFDLVIERGLEYYKNTLFDPDGTAKYYHDNKYPLDPHSAAQAVITLVKVGGKPQDIDLATTVLNWAVKELYIQEKKQFIYQKTSKITNSINYIRWTQAWMYLSMSYYLNSEGQRRPWLPDEMVTSVFSSIAMCHD